MVLDQAGIPRHYQSPFEPEYNYLDQAVAPADLLGPLGNSGYLARPRSVLDQQGLAHHLQA